MNRLNRYLIAGILMVAPLAITIYIGYQIVIRLDAQMHRLLPDPYSSVPGMGIVVLVVALIFIGFITTGVIGRLINRSIDLMLALVPVPMVRSVYGTLRQMLEQIFSSNSSAFREVVMVEYPRRGVYALGFLSGEAYEACQVVHGMRLFNVFVPTTPNPTSGFLLLVPETEIFRTKLSVEEGIKLVVSSGIVHPDIDAPSESRANEQEGLAGHERPFASSSAAPSLTQGTLAQTTLAQTTRAQTTRAQDVSARISKRVDGRLTVMTKPTEHKAKPRAEEASVAANPTPKRPAAKPSAKSAAKSAAKPAAKPVGEPTTAFQSPPSPGLMAQKTPSRLAEAKTRTDKAKVGARPKLASRRAKGSNGALRSS